MENMGKVFTLLGVIFLVMGLLWNIVGGLPKIPGDIYIDRPGVKIYIPVISAIILSVILTLLFNFFRK